MVDTGSNPTGAEIFTGYPMVKVHISSIFYKSLCDPVLQFFGNGSFDHETDTREAALILVFPRTEEGIACSILHEEAF